MINTKKPPHDALAVLDQFTAAFNRQDSVGMDAVLHFPHVFLGDKLQIWQAPGSLSAEFFPKLVESGWAFTRYTKKELILVTDERVHFLVTYDRCRADGSVLMAQAAVWIVTRINGKWGIQARSIE
jgi:hypothetical protein